MTPNGRLPTFVIVGAQKSGTGSLAQYLRGHPDVFVAPREVHYFDRNFDRGVDWYRRKFAGAQAATAVGEKSPEYMHHPDVPERLASVVPQVRLLAVLRNPVDRAYSHYWHNQTRGLEPRSFAEALASEPERLAGGEPYATARFGYLHRGRYLVQLERLTRYFERTALRVILFEDLRDDRLRAVRSVYRFIGVRDDLTPPTIEEVRNPFIVFRSQRLRKPIRRLPGPLRRVAARLNIRYVRYPPMDAALRKSLLERFSEDNAALADWLNADLGVWER